MTFANSMVKPAIQITIDENLEFMVAFLEVSEDMLTLGINKNDTITGSIQDTACT